VVIRLFLTSSNPNKSKAAMLAALQEAKTMLAAFKCAVNYW
jgi:hypothetical protein